MKQKKPKTTLQKSISARAREAFYKPLHAWALQALQYGLKHRDVYELLQIAFVNAAKHDLVRSRGSASIRDVADRAGVALPKTHKILRNGQSLERDVELKVTQDITGVIHHWRMTRPFGSKGKAKKLRIKADVGYDFRALCMFACPDRGYQKVLSELQESGCVRIEGGRVELNSNGFIQAGLDVESFERQAEHITDLINVYTENLNVDDHADGLTKIKHYHRTRWNEYPLDDPEATFFGVRAVCEDALPEIIAEIEKHESEEQEKTAADHTVKLIMAVITKPILSREETHET